MAELPSKTQLDKLGDWLRTGSRDEQDLRALDSWRRSFRPLYEQVTARIKSELNLEGTGRPAKSTGAIVDKLNRQRIRLTQIQDIAGFRVLVEDVVEQDRVVDRIRALFSGVKIDDRRTRPSHGYRAVHILISSTDRVVELQIRTREQHLWAEWSEKLSDVVDRAIKYGGGPPEIQRNLEQFSRFLQGIEEAHRRVTSMAEEIGRQEQEPGTRDRQALNEMKAEQLKQERAVKVMRAVLADLLKHEYNNL